MLFRSITSLNLYLSDCKEDANALREKVTERYKFKDVILNNIGPVIGTHAGPDALAVIFIGNERD